MTLDILLISWFVAYVFLQVIYPLGQMIQRHNTMMVRVGTAYIQELRFNNYCERLARLMIEEVFNQEFKLYLVRKGNNIDVAMFDLNTSNHHKTLRSYRQSRTRQCNSINIYTNECKYLIFQIVLQCKDS